jgi:hypothetical protein
MTEFDKYIVDCIREHPGAVVHYWGDYPDGSYSIIAYAPHIEAYRISDISEFGRSFWIELEES